jgi:hypothetical protein
LWLDIILTQFGFGTTVSQPASVVADLNAGALVGGRFVPPGDGIPGVSGTDEILDLGLTVPLSDQLRSSARNLAEVGLPVT